MAQGKKIGAMRLVALSWSPSGESKSKRPEGNLGGSLDLTAIKTARCLLDVFSVYLECRVARPTLVFLHIFIPVEKS